MPLTKIPMIIIKKILLILYIIFLFLMNTPMFLLSGDDLLVYILFFPE